MARPEIPSSKWYRAMNRVFVSEQVEDNLEVSLILKDNVSNFISWASEMMDNYGWLGFDYLIPKYLSNPFEDLIGLRKRNGGVHSRNAESF